jgi:hypothetical protein
MPTMTELFLAELERETPRTRRALEQVPEGKAEWTPHPKSMPLGYLAGLVATLPSWIVFTVKESARRREQGACGAVARTSSAPRPLRPAPWFD